MVKISSPYLRALRGKNILLVASGPQSAILLKTMKHHIVITGVTRGLGRELAIEFTRLGHTVVGCGRSEDKINLLKQNPGPAGNYTAIDVRDSDAINAWAEDSVKQHGPPDFILNNAGVINDNLPFWEISQEEFDSIIDINIKGVANVTRAFLPAMLKVKRGIIINFSSGYGHSTAPGVAPYCCTKYAVEGLTQALADDLPSGMAAIPMSPGIINTFMLQRTFGSSADQYETPDSWVKKAAPFILGLGPQDNGQSLRVPQ